MSDNTDTTDKTHSFETGEKVWLAKYKTTGTVVKTTNTQIVVKWDAEFGPRDERYRCKGDIGYQLGGSDKYGNRVEKLCNQAEMVAAYDQAESRTVEVLNQVVSIPRPTHLHRVFSKEALDEHMAKLARFEQLYAEIATVLERYQDLVDK